MSHCNNLDPIQSQTLNVWHISTYILPQKLSLNVGLNIPVPSRVDLGIDSQPFKNRVYKIVATHCVPISHVVIWNRPVETTITL